MPCCLPLWVVCFRGELFHRLVMSRRNTNATNARAPSVAPSISRPDSPPPDDEEEAPTFDLIDELQQHVRSPHFALIALAPSRGPHVEDDMDTENSSP